MAPENVHNSLNDMRENLEGLLQNILGHRLYQDAKRFAIRHPFISATIVTICIFSSVPLLFFLGFAIVTLFIALICFLCIEGSIIAVGGLIFIGVVSFISVIVIALLSAIATAYCIVGHIRSMFCSSQILCTNSVVETEANKEEKND